MKHTSTKNTHSTVDGAPAHSLHHNNHANDMQAIRDRAYAIYESHADPSRSPELDWLEAEQQLRANDARMMEEQSGSSKNVSAAARTARVGEMSHAKLDK